MATLKAMFKLFDGYSATIDRIYRKTDQATDKIMKASGATDKLNKQLEATGASAGKASSGLTKLIGKVITIAGIIKGMNLVDEYTYTAARLDLINDGLQTQAELQEKIFAAADRARGSYSDMAEAVSKMGLLAGEAFTSNDELIAFTELVQKSFKVSGAAISEQQGAMRQLTQAMASGRLQGDELVSIMENAPMIFDAIAKYMGLTKGELREIARTGAITSDIIKNAMFMAADDINAKFETMPMTFGDIWNKIKNRATMAFSSVMEDVNVLINTEGIERALDVITGGFVFAAKAAGWLIDTVVTGWDTIGPILAMLGGVYLANIIAKLWAMIPPLYAQAAAWLAMNWPILLIGVAIGLLIYAMLKFGDITAKVFGFIGGLIGVLVASIYNMIASITNAISSLGDFILNTVISIINTVISGINLVIKALNHLPGVNIGAVGGLEHVQTKRIEYIGLKDAWGTGQKIGQAFGGSLGNLGGKLTSLIPGYSAGSTGFDFSEFGTQANPVTVKGTGSGGKVKVDMADEDLKYLRDLAQREYINKFTTATLAPNIQISFGDVHETADADKVAKRIRKILQEEIAMAAEGSYA